MSASVRMQTGSSAQLGWWCKHLCSREQYPQFWGYYGGMSDEIKETKIRLPAGLHERLKQAAGRDHRSMHAQMIAYIERCLDADERRLRPRPRKDHDGS